MRREGRARGEPVLLYPTDRLDKAFQFFLALAHHLPNRIDAIIRSPCSGTDAFYPNPCLAPNNTMVPEKT